MEAKDGLRAIADLELGVGDPIELELEDESRVLVGELLEVDDAGVRLRASSRRSRSIAWEAIAAVGTELLELEPGDLLDQ